MSAEIKSEDLCRWEGAASFNLGVRKAVEKLACPCCSFEAEGPSTGPSTAGRPQRAWLSPRLLGPIAGHSSNLKSPNFKPSRAGPRRVQRSAVVRVRGGPRPPSWSETVPSHGLWHCQIGRVGLAVLVWLGSSFRLPDWTGTGSLAMLGGRRCAGLAILAWPGSRAAGSHRSSIQVLPAQTRLTIYDGVLPAS